VARSGGAAAGRAAALALAAALLGAGCASSASPWHVPAGSEERFREAQRVCHMLTDEHGVLQAERFDACMKRRGWKRQNLFRRLRLTAAHAVG
jgi:hypothetical protein